MARRYRPNWERLRLDYFRRRSPHRIWKLGLSVALPLLAGGWIALEASRGNQRIYTSGAMSAVHVQWTNQCSRCHARSFTRLNFWNNDREDRKAMNEACLHCHGTTIGHDTVTKVAWHQATGSDEAACSNCHSEHQGNLDLKDVPDRMCTPCHKNLKSKAVGELEFEPEIASFSKHPEFRFLRDDEEDPAHIKFKHKSHFRYLHEKETTHLPGPDGPVQLTCSNCHRAGRAGAEWPYAGQLGVHESDRLAATQSELDLQEAYMGTIRYSLHCAKCHRLSLPLWRDDIPGIDDSLEPAYVPHDTTAAIRAYLRGQFAESVQYPASAKPPLGRIPLKLSGDPESQENKLRTFEWIDEGIAFVENDLYKDKVGTCLKCHDMLPGNDFMPPQIVPPVIPARWLWNASFDHEKHKSIVDVPSVGSEVRPGIVSADIACFNCHEDAIASVETSEILLPGIEKCTECHGPSIGSATASTGVSDTCTTCHTYHRARRTQLLTTNPTGKAEE